MTRNTNALHTANRYALVRLAGCLTMLCCAAPVCAQEADPAAAPPHNPVEAIPEQPPNWLAGYQVRYTLRVTGLDVAASTSKSIVTRLPTGGWLKADGSDIAVQTADGTLLPVAVLSHAPAGDTLIQFPRHGADVWYWAYGVNPAAAPASGEPIPEGIVMEARDWTGDLTSWTTVRDGLSKAEPVKANSLVADIVQNNNPVRPGVPRNYAVTYRGHLNIKADGIYRFFVNSEDASFLFIDGFKVCDRPGTNPRMTGNIPTKSVGAELELTAGVHTVEVYHALLENPNSYGGCMLLWVPPEAKTWSYITYDNYARPDFAHVAALEAAGPSPGASFGFGIDDTLITAGGAPFHLARFEAQGDLPDGDSLEWDFGDGTTGRGRSARHVYFAPGEYRVSLSCGGQLPAFQRRIYVYGAPGESSPFSIGLSIHTLANADWKAFKPDQQDLVLDFLRTCDHADRWPLLAQLARHRLQADGLDPQFRAQLYSLLIEALGNEAKTADLQPTIDAAVKEFAKLPTLQVGVQLAAAGVYHHQLKDTEAALARYETILQEHRRLEHPDLRVAAIRWGDLLAESGDLSRAGELYRLAATLGGEDFLATAQAEAVTRGALLRVAEQKLRSGDIRETRMLLDKIELNYPEQKLEGLYRFMRAESDRFAGRYEDALKNYEVLLQLRQWSGYRDRTLHGMADCYARLDDIPQALKWLEQLEKAFPKYYAQQKLEDRQKLLLARQARAADQSGDVQATAKPPQFADFLTSFEPGEEESFGTFKIFKPVRGLGFGGDHLTLAEAHPTYLGYFTYDRPLPNLSAGGHYWVECWYRDNLYAFAPGFNPHMYLYVYGEGTDLHPTKGQGTYFMERTYGAWRKAGFALDAPPLAQDGHVTMMMLTVGAIEIDGLTVRAVSDRQLDALSNFIEGGRGNAE
ncbi:MAG: PKD domain-containing protein [Pirellulales bacterium]